MKLQFDEEVALEVGVDEAIMYSNLQYWCEKNKANEKHYYDGMYRTYNSMKAFTDLFRFWTEKQIRRILDNLEEKGYIKTGNYNKLSYDRTKWYACIGPNGQMHSPKRANGSDQMGEPIPNNKPDDKPNNKYSDDFLFFWKLFPHARTGDKKKALEEYSKSDIAKEIIIAEAQLLKQEILYGIVDGRYIKACQRWISGLTHDKDMFEKRIENICQKMIDDGLPAEEKRKFGEGFTSVDVREIFKKLRKKESDLFHKNLTNAK